MDLEQQIQELVDGAPRDGKTPRAVRAIAPVLRQVAEQLKRPQYYILQTIDQRWVITTLSSQAQSEVEKHVVYAFANHQDAAVGSQVRQNSQMMALPVPVIHLLFQILALNTVDSIIFFDTPGNTETGTEIRCQAMQDLIQAQLKQTHLNRDSNLPPDIA
jgi:hypothetical protein